MNRGDKNSQIITSCWKEAGIVLNVLRYMSLRFKSCRQHALSRFFHRLIQQDFCNPPDIWWYRIAKISALMRVCVSGNRLNVSWNNSITIWLFLLLPASVLLLSRGIYALFVLCTAYQSMSCLIIFWYEVLCLFASFLKNSILDFFNAIVILTFSSFRINWAGEGRKSLMTFNSPNGSSVYLILVFIYFPPFSPISGSEYSDNIASIGEPYLPSSHSKRALFITWIYHYMAWMAIYWYGWLEASNPFVSSRWYSCDSFQPSSVSPLEDYLKSKHQNKYTWFILTPNDLISAINPVFVSKELRIRYQDVFFHRVRYYRAS